MASAPTAWARATGSWVSRSPRQNPPPWEKTTRGSARSVVRYYTLVCVMVILSYLIIRGLSFLHIPAVPAKIIGDAALLVFNYHVQRHLVFRGTQKG